MALRTPLVAVAATALFFLCGCPSASPRDPGPVSGIRTSEFERLLDLEEKGRYREAIEAYEAVAADPSRSESDRVRAILRIARAREELRELVAARRAFEAILKHPGIMADENHLPPPGMLGIHYRLRAELGLVRTGGSPPVVYASLARSGTLPRKLVAIRSLGRLKASRGRSALLLIVKDAQADPILREAAREALEDIEKAEKG